MVVLNSRPIVFDFSDNGMLMKFEKCSGKIDVVTKYEMNQK